MDSHKYLFSVIPDGDKYTSLVTGIITSVVKVSMLTPKYCSRLIIRMIANA